MKRVYYKVYRDNKLWKKSWMTDEILDGDTITKRVQYQMKWLSLNVGGKFTFKILK